MANIIDPFGESEVSDYSHLFKEFGLSPLKPLLAKIKNPSFTMKRGILFAHRDFDKFLAAAKAGKKVAVMSGIKPTGKFHLGSKMTAEDIIYFQKEFKAKVFYCIADLEAYFDNGVSLEDSRATAVDNVADLLALGLDEKKAYIYKQSNELDVLRLAQLFAKKVTTNMMKAIYGQKDIGLYNAALIQAGDITLPQTEKFGGPKQVLVPVGVDQDPHMRLVRDLTKRLDRKLFLPASTYHKFFRNLEGESKMSKRKPLAMLTMSDSKSELKAKIVNALTGGRDTAEEQRKLGGQPDKCVIFELLAYHFQPDNKKLAGRRSRCESGKMLCGQCKEEVLEIIGDRLKVHQAKKAKLLKKAKKIVENA